MNLLKFIVGAVLLVSMTSCMAGLSMARPSRNKVKEINLHGVGEEGWNEE